MKIESIYFSIYFLALAIEAAYANGLRRASSTAIKENSYCKPLLAHIDYGAYKEEPEASLSCEFSDGKIASLDLPPGQVKNMIKVAQRGNTKLNLGSKRMDSNGRIVFTEGESINLIDTHVVRKLAVVTGSRSVLVVRVIASDGNTTASESQIASDVFEDTVCLKSQYLSCSHNKLDFVKAAPRIGTSTSIANGVVTVTIGMATSDGDVNMRNAITAELNSQFGVSDPTALANHAMYCLPTGTMSGIAYAFVNHWLSVYSNEWCQYVSAQMHEIGHNLGLGHSNEGTTEYADQSGMMGYSYGQDDAPIMCFNGAKYWQLGWLPAGVIRTFNTGSGALRLDLQGVVASWGETSAGETANNITKVVKIDTNTDTDYYVVYNRKVGFNSGTVEGGNQVTIVQQGGEGTSYSPSTLLAKLSVGQSYNIVNANVKVTVNSMDPLSGVNDKANICISGPGAFCTPCTSDSQCNDNNVCNGVEKCDVGGTGYCYVAPNTVPTCSGSTCWCDATSGCVAGSTVMVHIKTDNYPSETSWTMKNRATNDTVATGGGYTSVGTNYSSSLCTPKNAGMSFTIYDSYGDGICCAHGSGSYAVFYNGTQVASGGTFNSSETKNIDPPAPAPSPAPICIGTGQPCSSGTCCNGCNLQKRKCK